MSCLGALCTVHDVTESPWKPHLIQTLIPLPNYDKVGAPLLWQCGSDAPANDPASSWHRLGSRRVTGVAKSSDLTGGGHLEVTLIRDSLREPLYDFEKAASVIFALEIRFIRTTQPFVCWVRKRPKLPTKGLLGPSCVPKAVRTLAQTSTTLTNQNQLVCRFLI